MLEIKHRTVQKDYLKTMADAMYWDYIIETLDDYRLKLHNIMRLEISSMTPPLDRPQVYYRLKNKVASIVRLNTKWDMFDGDRTFPKFILHTMNFITLNPNHIFVIFTGLGYEALNYTIPENVLLVANCSGNDDDFIENLAYLQQIRERDNCRIGVYYDCPVEPLLFTDYDILFVGHCAYYKNPDLLSWIPEHPNTHFSPKVIRNNKWDKQEGMKLNIFRCF